MPSRLSIVLIASLAINAALLGVVGGSFLNKRPNGPGGPPRPPNDVVQAAWAQLPDADRGELRKELRAEWLAMAADRQKLQEAGKAVHDAAMMQPFDENRIRYALNAFQQRQQMMQHRAEDILISHLEKMPAEARATAATGLLTPFNTRVQRADRDHDHDHHDDKPGAPPDERQPLRAPEQAPTPK